MRRRHRRDEPFGPCRKLNRHDIAGLHPQRAQVCASDLAARMEFAKGNIGRTHIRDDDQPAVGGALRAIPIETGQSRPVDFAHVPALPAIGSLRMCSD